MARALGGRPGRKRCCFGGRFRSHSAPELLCNTFSFDYLAWIAVRTFSSAVQIA